ncbi:MAG: ferrous iron transport protein B [Phycisphaerae bacterium]|nr:ferrous iron transport protein B [Phycisphaerae bacterium]
MSNPGVGIDTHTQSGEGPAIAGRPPRVALVGNPNTGKTTLYNALTGFRHHVANYPGVTVSIAHGFVREATRPMELYDLPGTYSLAAASPDEAIVTDTLCGHGEVAPKPDAIIAIVDASNLTRNLYLVSQVLEYRLPMVIALNMVDVAESRGLSINAARLSQRLGVPVVPVVATKPSTVKPLIAAVEAVLERPASANGVKLPPALVHEAERLVTCETCACAPTQAVRLLLYKGGHAEATYQRCGGSLEHLEQCREKLRKAGIDGPLIEVQARYAWVNDVVGGVIMRPDRPIETWSDRIDSILTHPVGGMVALILVLYGVFWSLFSGAGPLMDLVDGAFGALGRLVAGWLPEGVLSSLIVDGVIAGVGGVLVFLPQILILFAAIAILEDCGYLARAASMMDRVMRTIGLSGRAFIPLLSAFACAVPAIMGTRAIADRRERFLTIMLAPFMSCSARLPVYAVMIATFVPATKLLGGWIGVQPLVMLAMYSIGIVVSIPVAWLLRRTLLAGPAAGFVLELPSYKWPQPRVVYQRVYQAGKSFIVRAGTVILVVNMIVWALAYFPRSESTRSAVEQQIQAGGWDDATREHELASAYLRDSYLGHMGRSIEPVIAPIGWDWKIGVAVIASFPAREVVVATLGTLFHLEDDAETESLRAALRAARVDHTDRPLFTLPVALSIMVFFALCAQCGATLAVMGREMGSWIYPVISFVGMTTLAYFAAWGVAAAARALMNV